ncbi:PIG-L family deacetylase [Neomoorella mulderi]|uniref:Glucosyl-3-phosphoglycerate synthase n=1 Tax=Moorella mulderi DSM 14980 TaxID=1122241 RepID=A0A151AVM4_9FIRM|nr:PIG-L family deacetylase [Moorella mulderi]KYH31714.1 glucosyl-3-phosphoglycerate synthase [Moorella mulderi DSM 14980]
MTGAGFYARGVSAVIPAYNEAATVGKVIDTLKEVASIAEIIVVSDGSQDATASVARRHGARVIELATNGGKGAAMTVGARAAREDILLFLDADLEGLTAAHVEALVVPLLAGSADMTVGIFSRGRSLTDLAQVVAPHLSGQRAIRKELFLAVGAEKSRFEVEVLLTSEARARGWRVQKIPLANMTHIMKEEKRGLYRGIVARMGMYKDILGYILRLTRKKIKARPVALLLLLLVLAVAMNYDVLALRAAAAAAGRMPDLELPAGGHRILVISPHPDDETLGAGGLIAEARDRGDAVKVVIMTNGDGFRRGVEKFNGPLPAGASDFLQYGQVRQQEAITALGVLGVKSSDIIFLGYPDGGLAPIWLGYWGQDRPFTSVYTRQAAVPYKLAFAPGEPYTAPALLQTLVEILKDYRPTDIYVTDTNDSHPDHWATGAFTLAATGKAREEDPSFRPNLYTFVIHTGTWQMLPVIERKAKPLLPPGYFLSRGTPWYKLPLSPEAMDRKKKAIAAYKTQELVMPTFLANFERPNEVFSHLVDQQMVQADSSAGGDGEPAYWPESARVALDPAGDQLTRKLEKGGDLKAAYLLQAGNTTFVRLDTWGRPGFPVIYTASIYLLPGKPAGQVQRFILQVAPGERQARWLARPAGYNPGPVRVIYREHSVEMALPGLVPPGEHHLMFAAATSISKIPLDRIPWRLLQVNGGDI